jgi:hypothetical protein
LTPVFSPKDWPCAKGADKEARRKTAQADEAINLFM